jgi:integrase
MRCGELLGLRWKDVDLEGSTIRVRRTLTREGNGYALGEPKTKKSRRTLRLTQRAVDALRSHRASQAQEKLRAGSLYQDRDLVFAGEGGGLLNPSNLRQRSFAPLLKRAGLDQVTFHDLQHTCASLLFQKNVHPKFVQELLGHASVAITLDTYSLTHAAGHGRRGRRRDGRSARLAPRCCTAAAHRPRRKTGAASQS